MNPSHAVAGPVAGPVVWLALAVTLGAAGCGGAPVAQHPQAAGAPLSLAADAHMLAIPAGQYIAGSTPEERATAYDDHRAAGSTDVARTEGWFDDEEDRHVAQLGAFHIDLMPVTQAAYAEFVATGAVAPPAIDELAWRAQGFPHDYATEVARFVWPGPQPPGGREDHPVVLVTWDEARRYCAWRGELRGAPRRLPTAPEFEKAARGASGMAYPWGNTFERAHLNTLHGGSRDTVPVGSHVGGASPFGALDMAGNVAQWTSTAGAARTGAGAGAHMLVKGSAWDALPGLGRGAARRAWSVEMRHVLVGFRCAADPPPH